MKHIFFTAILAALLAGCSKEIKTYDGQAFIYFTRATEQEVPGVAVTDSSLITFAFGGINQTDSLIKLYVKATGQPQPADRPYTISMNPATTAQAGVHYDILNTDLSVKAGRVADTLLLLLHRTPDMVDSSFNIVIDLAPNNYFGTDLDLNVVSTTRTISTIRQKVVVNDILKRPARWLDAYLGPFTRKKFFLMAELLGFPLNKLEASVSVAEITFYGKFMQRYLNEQKQLGNTILEDDGTEMAMGPSSQ